MAIEQVSLRVNVERGMSFLMQRAESHELRPGADALSLPVVPIQEFQKRNTVFELFEILAHDVHTSQHQARHG